MKHGVSKVECKIVTYTMARKVLSTDGEKLIDDVG